MHNSGNRLGTLGPRCCPAGTNRPAKQLSVCPASEGINPRSKDSAPLPGLAPTTLAHTGGPLYDWGPWERTAAPARAKIQRQPSLPGSRHARIRPRGRADRLNQHSGASPAPPSCNMPLLSHNRSLSRGPSWNNRKHAPLLHHLVVAACCSSLDSRGPRAIQHRYRNNFNVTYPFPSTTDTRIRIVVQRRAISTHTASVGSRLLTPASLSCLLYLSLPPSRRHPRTQRTQGL